ncbi:MAG: hypothetical protein DMG08_01635 [Acidobacteria bacterium]|nr:MAG: hypothetical protein DMG08_01635 [Acidobacteriota bacterium]
MTAACLRDIRLFVPCLALFVSACAKTGDPQPPLVLIPKPAADLAARQSSDKLVLTVSAPVENTDGSPVSTLAEVEVLRLVEERAGNLPVKNEEEFLARAQLLVKVPAQKLPAYRQGGKLVFHDDLVFEDRSIIYKRGLRYAVRFINGKNQTAGLSNQVYVAPLAIPGPPRGLSFQLGQEYIRILWPPPETNLDGSTPPRIAGYNVYRTEDPRSFPPAPLNKQPLRATEFEDREFQFDKTYYYLVSVVGSVESPYAESLPSAPLAVPAQDTFPPEPPGDLHAVAEGGIVILFWTAPPQRDVAGYRIYRREPDVSEWASLDTELVTTLSYRDEKPGAGQKYEYRVTAVDTHGNESQPATVPVELQ